MDGSAFHIFEETPSIKNTFSPKKTKPLTIHLFKRQLFHLFFCFKNKRKKEKKNDKETKRHIMLLFFREKQIMCLKKKVT